MKVYLELPRQSRGIGRVRDALVRYKPANVEITRDPLQADLTIIHVIGRHDKVEQQINALQEAKKPYAMIQYCLRSTKNPHTSEWIGMWKNATLVWSYYDLLAAHTNDTWTHHEKPPFNFYYAPLGVDAAVFHDEGFKKRQYIIAATSQHYLSESVKECWNASQMVQRKMLFIGHELRRTGVDCVSDIDDDELQLAYSQSVFVSGLRRVEGFELPVIEGLLCGARPIVFDRPEMRHWFNGLAIFVKEEPREQVIKKLTQIFEPDIYPAITSEAYHVRPEEIALAKERFNWQTIIEGFWEKVL